MQVREANESCANRCSVAVWLSGPLGHRGQLAMSPADRMDDREDTELAKVSLYSIHFSSDTFSILFPQPLERRAASTSGERKNEKGFKARGCTFEKIRCCACKHTNCSNLSVIAYAKYYQS